MNFRQTLKEARARYRVPTNSDEVATQLITLMMEVSNALAIIKRLAVTYNISDESLEELAANITETDVYAALTEYNPSIKIKNAKELATLFEKLSQAAKDY